MSKGLVLIASYPKSGNTWTRIVLEKLKKAPGKPVSLNSMDDAWFGYSRRTLFDMFAPVDAEDLTWDEIDLYYPDIYRRLSEHEPDRVFVKVHDKLRKTVRGEWVYPPECVRAALYVSRHPFDVAVSAAYHLGASLEGSVEIMGANGLISSAQSHLPMELMSPPYSWSESVDTWLASPYRMEIARYEDMYADPVEVFLRLAIAAGFDVAVDEIRRVVEETRFDRMQEEENRHGFRERSRTSTAQFFRAGRPGTWRGVLSASLQAQIVRDHGAAMERLGYKPDGNVVAMPE